jgi:outer membrane protein
MLRNTCMRVFMMAAGAALFAGLAAAQLKVAVVDSRQAVLSTAEIKKASADLEAKYKPRQAEMERLRKDLDEIQQKLQAGADKLTPQATSELNATGQRKQRDLQRLSQDLQEEVEAERQDILSKTSQRMLAVVKQLAETRGLDVVIDSSTTLFFKPALDLTKDAVAEYDKAYPVK